MTESEKKWTKYAQDRLLGKTIKSVRYMDSGEVETMGFQRKALVLTLNDGTLLWPSMDDEGNDAGAMFFQTQTDDGVLPVL
jgi:hypothetical protein